MQKKIAIRAILGLLAIAALFVGYQLFAEWAKDPDPGKFDSQGMVLAIEYDSEGDHAVLFDSTGTKTTPPADQANKKGFRDTEATWSADGNRVFMSSNRKTNAFNVHRWNPPAKLVEARRESTRYQGAPWFDPNNDPYASTNGLIISGGYVLDYNTRTATTIQILPPVTKDRVQDAEGGTASPMDTLFGQIGDTFLKARWAKNRDAIYCIMRGEGVQVGVLTRFPKSGELVPPAPIFKAQNVDVDVAPDGKAIFTVRGALPSDDRPMTPEEIKAGKREAPFDNGVFIVDYDETGKVQFVPIVIFKRSEKPDDPFFAFADAAVSPDGTKIAVVVGTISELGEFVPSQLLTMPLEAGGGQKATPIVQGRIHNPSWSPDGSRIVYTRTDGETNNVYTVSSSGGQESRLSENGRYSMPRFSPQTSAP